MSKASTISVNNSRQNGFDFANTQFPSRLDPFGVFLCGPLRSLREMVLTFESMTPFQMGSFLRLPQMGLDLRMPNSRGLVSTLPTRAT
jgi:hypothetical protein